jgi:hypothetical protein
MGIASFVRELLGRTDAAAEKDRILDLNKLKLQEEFARAREKVGFSVQFALLVLRGLTLVNGGAIIALFSFLGASAQRSQPLLLNNVGLLWWCFGLFSGGLSLAILASFLAYMAQYHQADAEYTSPYNNYIDLTGATDAKLNYQEHIGRFRKFRMSAFIAGLLSLAAFVAGSATALGSALPTASRDTVEVRAPSVSRSSPAPSVAVGPPTLPSPVPASGSIAEVGPPKTK